MLRFSKRFAVSPTRRICANCGSTVRNYTPNEQSVIWYHLLNADVVFATERAEQFSENLDKKSIGKMLGVDLTPLLTSSLIVVATVIFFSWYSKRNHDYWKKRGIPFVKPAPFFGSVLENISTPSPDLDMKRLLEFGPLYGHFEMNRPYLNVGDPKILKKILVKDFASFSTRREFSSNNEVLDSMIISIQGDDWKRIRAIARPTFSSSKLKKMIGIIKECSETLLQNLKTASMQDNQVDVKRLYGAYTMDVIASTAFSTKIDSHNDPDNLFVSTAKKSFQNRFGWRYLMHLSFPDLMKFLGVSYRTTDVKIFINVILKIIEERKRSGQTKNDFLQLLLDTSKEVEKVETLKSTQEKETGDISNNHNATDKTTFKKNLTMHELVAQCVIFFLGGYDNTSSTLSYITYCLALNDEVQETLYEEIDRVYDEQKGELTYETLQDMKYLDNVISETLRLYPPVSRFERIATKDYESTDLSLKIPKGMVIGIPIFAMHRDPRHYPDPEKFDPDRFSLEEKAKRDPYTYLPFAHGPRNCIAGNFALLEIKMCLVDVIRNFKIKRCSKTKVPLEFCPSRNKCNAKEITVEMEPRQKTSLY